ncbi:MAG TPA: formate dehydrogenase accessory sulfurtransferase FdhD [Bacillota bacterium]|nr:formate dehydrogenase accessory sulfurtransferase FdhD [Bacillota bacterium]
MDEMIENGWRVIRFQGDSFAPDDECIVIESPLTIMLNGEEFATIVCTPTNIHELLVGFLASEGIIRFYDDIKDVTIDQQKGFAYVELHRTLSDIHKHHSKRFIGSCCGKSRQLYFTSDVKTAKTITNQLTITAHQCYHLMTTLQQQSISFQKTGGIHNAALCTVDHIILTHTDIGRHNTLDKIYGDILMKRIPLADKLIVFSGRVSSEVLLKLSKIGIGLLLSKSAPTDLALQLAQDLGITVIGFLRNQQMNVYTHPQRILEANQLLS